MAARLWSVVFDAADPVTLGRFWADALDWTYAEDDGFTAAVGPALRLEFVDNPREKRTPNWTHFDLSSASLDDQQSYVERLLDLGATHLDIGQGADAEHVVLADPEGNELCVLEPGNSFVDYGTRLGALSSDGSPECGYFWRDVLGWPLIWDQDEETAIRASDGGVFFTFGGPRSTPKREKNRLHLDITPPPGGSQDDEVERLLALGAHRVDVGQGDASWVVLADPDGNELCVLTPRGSA